MIHSADQDWASGSVALITGATSGFGAALARRLAAAGGKVIATGRRQDRLDRLASETGGDLVMPLQLDVRSRHSILHALGSLPPDFASIDILFNNAGLALGLESAQKAQLEDWEEMIETNIAGLARVTHAVLPGMVERGRGHVLNLSSVAASYPGANIYGASKAFVRQFSLNLRADLLGTPIRVTSLEPGMCETEFSLVRFRGDRAAAERVYAGMKPLSADDVVDVVEAVLRLPPHVNVNSVELMPVDQAFGPFLRVERASEATS